MNEMTVTGWGEITQILAPMFDRQNVRIKIIGDTAELAVDMPEKQLKARGIGHEYSVNKRVLSKKEMREICAEAAVERYKRSFQNDEEDNS